MTGETITRTTAHPLLAEDLLLVLFQPSSGTIAGENTLFYVLAGAIVADLAQQGSVELDDSRSSVVVRATGQRPHDDLLRPAWDYVAKKPRGVQTVLAATGPTLRGPVLDRLFERGDIAKEERRALGVFPTTALVEGPTGRRPALVAASAPPWSTARSPTTGRPRSSPSCRRAAPYPSCTARSPGRERRPPGPPSSSARTTQPMRPVPPCCAPRPRS
jgi:hypothetical protein